jgi:hypothetical protein
VNSNGSQEPFALILDLYLKKSMENMINIRGRVLKEGHDSVMLASIHDNQRCCRQMHEQWMTNYEREISYYHMQRGYQ